MDAASEPRPPRPMAAGHVIVVVFIALLGGAVLNGQALADAADRQPFGWRRTLAVVAAAPFDGMSRLLGLDRPREILAETAAEVTGAAGTTQDADEPDPPPATQPPPDDPEPTPAPTPTSSPTDAARERREISRRDPLRVWVGGDSLTSEFGPALADRLARGGLAETEVEYRFSTGLSRPDYFDWPSRFAEIIDELDPDAFVVMFGANDGQNIAVDGEVLAFPSDEWRREYARRVSEVMDLLADDGRLLYWVGQPIMADGDFDTKMRVLNGIYARQARARGDVHFVATRGLFSDDGAYSAYLSDDDGQRLLVRQQDGIHFTRAGGERLTDVVAELIDQEWDVLPGGR